MMNIHMYISVFLHTLEYMHFYLHVYNRLSVVVTGNNKERSDIWREGNRRTEKGVSIRK